MSVRVQVPADIDREDRLLGDLTGRQVLTLLVAGLAAWLVWSLTGPTRLVWFVAGLVPIVVVAALLTWGRRDGVALDRVALAALRQRLQSPGHPGPRPPEAPADLAPGRSRTGARGGRGRLVVPRVPVRGVHGATTELGVLDLGPRGMAVVCSVTPIPLALRSESEQDAAVAGLGAWLSALSGPVQILTRTRHLDLADVIEATAARAAGLPHPALAAAAHDHAAHLAALATEADLTTREHLLIFRDPTPARPHGAGPGVRGRAALTAVELLWRRADEATALLGRLGLHVQVLDAPTAADVVHAATRPDRRPRHPTHHPPPPTPRAPRNPPNRPGRPGTREPSTRDTDLPTVPLGPFHLTHPAGGPSSGPSCAGPRPPAPTRPHHLTPPSGPHHRPHDPAPRDPAPHDPGPQGFAVGEGEVDDVAVQAANDADADRADGGWSPGRIRAALDPQEGRAR